MVSQIKINSITSQDKIFLGTVKQNFSRAELHTKAETLNNRTLPGTKNQLKSKETGKNRQIVFIGHSATWLPLEHTKPVIDDVATESNKQIVFVGHSATWIPTSPSKQISSSFSTSAIGSISSTKQNKQNISETEEKIKIKTPSEKNKNLNSTTQSIVNEKDIRVNEILAGSRNENTNKIAAVLKRPPKIIESIAVIDKNTKELKIVSVKNATSEKKSDRLIMNENQKELLNAIENFTIPSDDIILSVPRYNVNKYVTSVDPKLMSTEVEKIVSQLEETIQKHESDSTIKLNDKNNEKLESKQEKNRILKENHQVHVEEITLDSNKNKHNTSANFKTPEKVIILDKTTDKLKTVPSKENPQLFEEAKLQNKTIETLQAQTNTNYSLKHWPESDSNNNTNLKEEPILKDYKDSNLSADLQKKVTEIREYADKMSRFTLKSNSSVFDQVTYESNCKVDVTKVATKSISPTSTVLPRCNDNQNLMRDKMGDSVVVKEPVFIGNMCYWIPKLKSQGASTIKVISEPINGIEDKFVDRQTKNLNISNGTLQNISPTSNLSATEYVVGNDVLSKIIVKDKRKYKHDLWENEAVASRQDIVKASTCNINHPETEKTFSISKIEENTKVGNIVESFGIPVPTKSIKENIQLKDPSLKSKSSPKPEVDQKENYKTNTKSNVSFQAAQLEKNTEKYSTITNQSVNLLKDKKIEKVFEPIKVIMDPIQIPSLGKEKDLNKQNIKKSMKSERINTPKDENFQANKIKRGTDSIEDLTNEHLKVSSTTTAERSLVESNLTEALQKDFNSDAEKGMDTTITKFATKTLSNLDKEKFTVQNIPRRDKVSTKTSVTTAIPIQDLAKDSVKPKRSESDHISTTMSSTPEKIQKSTPKIEKDSVKNSQFEYLKLATKTSRNLEEKNPSSQEILKDSKKPSRYESEQEARQTSLVSGKIQTHQELPKKLVKPNKPEGNQISQSTSSAIEQTKSSKDSVKSIISEIEQQKTKTSLIPKKIMSSDEEISKKTESDYKMDPSFNFTTNELKEKLSRANDIISSKPQNSPTFTDKASKFSHEEIASSMPDSLIAKKSLKQIHEKSKIEQVNENLAKSEPLGSSNSETASKTSKIVTDQFRPTNVKLGDNMKQNSSTTSTNSTSFSSQWSKLQTKAEPVVITSVSQAKSNDLTKENKKSKLEDKDQMNVDAKSIIKPLQNTKNIKSSLKDSTILNLPNEQNLSDSKKDNKINETLVAPKTAAKISETNLTKGSVKEAKEITPDVTTQVSTKVESLKKSIVSDSNSSKSTAGFLLIEENLEDFEKAKKWKENVSSKLKEKTNENKKSDKANANATFVLVEEKLSTEVSPESEFQILKDKTIKNSKDKIFDKPIKSNLNIKSTKSEDTIKHRTTQPIILGPPKSSETPPKTAKFVLVNTTSQTYSTAEPLLNESVDSIEPVSKQPKMTGNIPKTNTQLESKEELYSKIVDSKIIEHKADKPGKHIVGSNQNQERKFDHKLNEVQKEAQPVGKIDSVTKVHDTINKDLKNEAFTSANVIKPVTKENRSSAAFAPKNVLKEALSTSKSATVSLVNKTLEDVARKNELTGKTKPQLDQPKLIVDNSLPNRFNVDTQISTKTTIKNIEVTSRLDKVKMNTGKIEKEPSKFETIENLNAEILKPLTTLEKAYKRIDKKLDQIQNEISSKEGKGPVSAAASIADPNSLKELRQNFKISSKKEFVEKTHQNNNLTESINSEKNLNPKIDDENIIRKTYIPLSFHVSTAKDESKLNQSKTKLKLQNSKSESPYINIAFLKNYLREKPKQANINKKKTESIFKQVSDMIKEELFTYHEAPKETNKNSLKLAEESCASQPTTDGKTTMKPGLIYDQVKNMLKEDLRNEAKSKDQFVNSKLLVPGAATKIQTIIDDNLKKKYEDNQLTDASAKENEIKNTRNFINKTVTGQKTSSFTNEIVKSTVVEKQSIAYAETSVVPESIVVTESPPSSQQFSQTDFARNHDLNTSPLNSAKVEFGVSTQTQSGNIDDKKKNNSKSSADLSKSDNRLISNLKLEPKSNLESETLLSHSNYSSIKKSEGLKVNTTESQNVKPLNKPKSFEETIQNVKNDEEELYKILGMSNEPTLKSRKIKNEPLKPTESVMDKLRNYFEKSSSKSEASSVANALQSDNIDHKIKEDIVTESEKIVKINPRDELSKISSQLFEKEILHSSSASQDPTSIQIKEAESKVITDSAELDKPGITDKMKSYLKFDSNNNSPYHMIKPISLLEHLTNMDTEQVKIDHHIKLLAESRSNSINNIESNKLNSPRIDSPLLQIIERDDVLITPNPERVASISTKNKKMTVQRNEKVSSEENSKIKNGLSQAFSVDKNIFSKSELSSSETNLEAKKVDKSKQEEEEEEEEEEIKGKTKEKQRNSILEKSSSEVKPKIEMKPSENNKDSNNSSKDSFSKDSVKPLDKSRHEPVNIIEGPGPSILDIENDNTKTSTTKPKISEPPTLSNIPTTTALDSTSIGADKKQKTKTSQIPNTPDLINSNNAIKNQQLQMNDSLQKPLKIKQVRFDQNPKFIKPSKPLIRELNSIAKSNQNISSTVLEDFKVEMDRYNSVEATPEDKNKIVLKIKYLTKIEPSPASSQSAAISRGQKNDSQNSNSKEKK